ncbi:hypothetical protein B0H17DRAFT_1098449 [Mycena rosella]|uniref:Uncharacterized protein n=1 Tax=Mycena rosella TaxID=1033263 RepID=A0AAD7CPE4_MYCRO|nr:hypothetical protein B0H17DRAFT_1098449 [Mycena rosella]
MAVVTAGMAATAATEDEAEETEVGVAMEEMVGTRETEETTVRRKTTITNVTITAIMEVATVEMEGMVATVATVATAGTAGTAEMEETVGMGEETTAVVMEGGNITTATIKTEDTTAVVMESTEAERTTNTANATEMAGTGRVITAGNATAMVGTNIARNHGGLNDLTIEEIIIISFPSLGLLFLCLKKVAHDKPPIWQSGWYRVIMNCISSRAAAGSESSARVQYSRRTKPAIKGHIQRC